MTETNRKLASVRKIGDVSPIEGADEIECVTVDGWQVVAKKDQFKKGDLCVYFEIDSFLPILQTYEFLRKGCYRNVDGLGEGFRLKTIRLRGQISQGLVLPLSDFDIDGICEGTDMTGELGVIKWDPPVPTNLAGVVKGNFPSFINKTDQQRMQNIGRHWKDYLNQSYEMTLKMDGSSMTVYCNNHEFGVCSRNYDLEFDENNSFWNIANSTITPGPFNDRSIIERIEMYCMNNEVNLAFQGELVGPGVNGNHDQFSEHHFLIFDIFDIDSGTYLPAADRYKIVAKLKLEHVPVVIDTETSDYDYNVSSIEDWTIMRDFLDGSVDAIGNVITLGPEVDYKHLKDMLLQVAAHIPSYNNDMAEGIVFKSIENPLRSFKLINDQFLLKEK